MNLFSRSALLILFCLRAAAAQEPTFDADPLGKLVGANHYKRARTMAEARLRQDPKDAHALYLSSKIHVALGDVPGAVTFAEKAVAIDAGNATYHGQLAECYAYAAEHATLMKSVSYMHLMKKEIAAALAIRAHDSDTLLVAMMFAFHAPAVAGGDRKKAHAIADEILQNDPHWGWLAKARLAQEESPDDQIEALLKKAVQADPKHYRAFQELATFYCCVSKHKNAAETERVGKQMVALDPSQATGYGMLASAYARAARYAELDAVLAQSEKTVPDDLTPYYQAAAALIDVAQELPRAEKYIAHYVSQDPEGRQPDRVQAKWLLASLYEKGGRTPEAIRELEAAVRMRPDFEPAKKDLKRLRRS